MGSIYKFRAIDPSFNSTNYIAPNATLIGDVRMDENSSIWFGSVARGDINYISIGKNSNIQDLTMLHVTKDLPCIIKDNVSIGHNANIHGCIIENNCLIGMGAIILDGAIIGENSVVAAGAIVPPGKTFPKGSMIMGTPAKLIRSLTSDELIEYGNHYKRYVDNKNEYLKEKII